VSGGGPGPGQGVQLLAGRRAVVTGAARGIGLAVATRFAAHGASVAVLDLDQSACDDAAARIHEATGVTTVPVAVDVSTPDSVLAAADVVSESLGVADIVVPNAGVLVLKPVLDLSPEEFQRVVQVNLVGAFLTASEFSRRMVQAGSPGQVILISSLFGLRGGAGNAAYAASKFGVVGLAQSMAADLAPQGIRVNSVCPGQIDSAMLTALFETRASSSGSTVEQEHDLFVSHVPMARLGTADEVADSCVYLASHLSAYVTGQQLVVDGGWSVG